MSAWSALVSCLAIAMAQQPGTLKTEGNLTISVKECDANECTTKSHKLFLDANWRWIRTEDFENCHAGNAWDDSICADATTCAQKWQAEAVDAEGYEKTYGITAVPGGVQLNLVTKDGENRNLASRLFLLEDDDNYKLFDLNNCEFALDVDSSTVQCGMNGAMCFVEMAANGGLDLGANKAGAKFGTGYCDAQRPYDISSSMALPTPRIGSHVPRISATAWALATMVPAVLRWTFGKPTTWQRPTPRNPARLKRQGDTCAKALSVVTMAKISAMTDFAKDSCDINPFRNGRLSFYGPGPENGINSLKPMTVLTQFLTNSGQDDGDLAEIRRFYAQDEGNC